MLYALFLGLAIAYNWRKFGKDRETLLSSLVQAKSAAHREMILSHLFYVFIFEGFLAFLVAHFSTERSFSLGMLELGLIYLVLLFAGFFLYSYFVQYLEKHTGLSLMESFQRNLIKEIRVNFALVLLPILLYSIINLTFQDSVFEEWGSMWFVGLVFNIIFVSVLTITCTVIIMLKMIPNREITEPEYLEIINKRLAQIGMPGMRVRWIETDIKNAFVVGLKLLRFSNQTMFIGRSLRETLSFDEFDAVICHELAHVANRHIQKRLLDLLKNFISAIVGIGTILILVMGISFLYWGEDAIFHANATATWSLVLAMAWVIFNYALLFDNLRSHEYEADGFAVIQLGANLDSMKSVLKKLEEQAELPEYLRNKTKRNQSSWFKNWVQRYFSTHPKTQDRVEFLERKVREGLPFNYYVSSAEKIRKYLSYLLQWRVALPLTTVFAITMTMSVIKVKRGQETIAWIHKANPEEIVASEELAQKINSSPTIIGPSFMYYIVKKHDEKLIEHFLEKGADKGKVLVYLAQVKDFALLENYYVRFQQSLTEEEYFMVLRKTAEVDFTEGYRLLVNAQRFEELNPEYKEDVSRLHESKRRPASVEQE